MDESTGYCDRELGFPANLAQTVYCGIGYVASTAGDAAGAVIESAGTNVVSPVADRLNPVQVGIGVAIGTTIVAAAGALAIDLLVFRGSGTSAVIRGVVGR